MRWPLYPFEICFSLLAIALTMRVWHLRGRGWAENIVIIPWLISSAAFATYLLIRVAANNWQDIAPTPFNALLSNVVLVAGPVSVVIVMCLRLRNKASL